MAKLWVKILIWVGMGLLALFGLFVFSLMTMSVKYGTPHYRPKVE